MCFPWVQIMEYETRLETLSFQLAGKYAVKPNLPKASLKPNLEFTAMIYAFAQNVADVLKMRLI